MQFHHNTAEVYAPDNLPVNDALMRTTHMAIAAHQDDIEMMVAQPILECFNRDHKWFSGVVMTDGRGSPRAGKYQHYTDNDMCSLRTQEQFRAASFGKYAAQVVLKYSSTIVKDWNVKEPIVDLVQILHIAKPQFVYSHNLADKHDTHVAVALRVIEAIRALPQAERPAKLYGCEVWRGLDWLLDDDKVKMDLSEHEDLQAALINVFESQIAGGKRYDLATMGRRRANATFLESHKTDTSTGLALAMDMSPLIFNDELDPSDFVHSFIERFAQDVDQRLQKFS